MRNLYSFTGGFNPDRQSWMNQGLCSSLCHYNLWLVQLICEERPGHLQAVTCLTCTSLQFPSSQVWLTRDNTQPLWLFSGLRLQTLPGQRRTWEWCLGGSGETPWRKLHNLSGTHRMRNHSVLQGQEFQQATMPHALRVLNGIYTRMCSVCVFVLHLCRMLKELEGFF